MQHISDIKIEIEIRLQQQQLIEAENIAFASFAKHKGCLG
jgi:hypothetical protein